MASAGDPPTDYPDSRPQPEQPRGTSYGRAGARWMVDPEAVWRPDTSRAAPAAYAVMITDACIEGRGPRVLQADTGFARMTGYTADATGEIRVDSLAGPATDRDRLAAALARLAAGSADGGATVQYRRDGTPFGMAWSAEPVPVDAGRTTHFVWILQEIDVDSAVAEGDRAAPALPAIIVTAARTADFADDRIVHVNKGFSALTGYGADDLCGSTPAILQGEASPMGERERLRRALAGGWPCRVELLNYTRDGRPFWNALDLLPLRSAQGATEYWLGLAHDVTEDRDRAQRRYEAAYYDDLTGLPNRALAQARIERAIRLAHRNRGRVALLYIDLDGFDALRGRFSRPELNDCLSRLATRFADATRRSDTLAYVGGDEFLVVAEDIATPEEGRDIAARLNAVAARPIRLGGARESIGASIGISVYPDHGGDPEQLLQRADAALIQARSDGGSVGLYSPARMGARLDRLCVEDELRGAIQRDEFAVALQPVVALDDGRVIAHEAFARWHHPREGWIPPGDFLPRMFARGLAGLISERVQTLASAALALWWTVLSEPRPRLVLNVAGAELAAGGFAAGLRARVAAQGLPLAAVELDVRAELLRSATGTEVAELVQLRAEGVTLTLDACAHPDEVAPVLGRLPLDRIKLAIRMVRDIHLDPTRRDLAVRLATLANGHGLAVTAAGVETAEEAEYLADIGCPTAQGYRFGRPEII